MAKDVITRFKLETTQYDSALRNETSRLKDFSKTAALAGKDFDKFTKSNVEAARALGTAATGATNAKDKVKELVSSYNSLANAYNSLSAIQKQSDFAKAWAESLTTLQGRIKDAKQELYNAGDGVNSFGGVLDQLAQKFTINVDALKLFEYGLKAANVAMDVAKDVFFASETNIDTWGRTVASTQGIYESFLQTLNNGDFSGFFSGIDSVINKAKEAYNAMDELQYVLQ